MINLLPPKIKREQKLRQISVQINTAVFALLVMVGLAYSAVYFVNFYLSSQIDKNNDTLSQTKLEIARLKPVEDDINTINAKITKMNTLKNNRYDWSSVLADINNSTPKSIQIQSLQVDQKSAKVNISALAETRSDIVKFQAGLEDLPYLKNMSFESSTFNSGTNNYSFVMLGALGK